MWERTSAGNRTLLGITAVNAAIFVCWRVPRLHSWASRYFLHSPYTGRIASMVGSAFSHRSALHLGANMMVLWSFGPVAMRSLDPENFVAFYITAGAFSSLVSQLWSVATRCVLPGLGASGAIMGLIALAASVHPEAEVCYCNRRFNDWPCY
jgi:rhomboid-like protein